MKGEALRRIFLSALAMGVMLACHGRAQAGPGVFRSKEWIQAVVQGDLLADRQLASLLPGASGTTS